MNTYACVNITTQAKDSRKPLAHSLIHTCSSLHSNNTSSSCLQASSIIQSNTSQGLRAAISYSASNKFFFAWPTTRPQVEKVQLCRTVHIVITSSHCKQVVCVWKVFALSYGRPRLAADNFVSNLWWILIKFSTARGRFLAKIHTVALFCHPDFIMFWLSSWFMYYVRTNPWLLSDL